MAVCVPVCRTGVNQTSNRHTNFMESLLKYLPIDTLVMLLQIALIKVGNKLKDKDDNDTGDDDAAGNVLIAIAPVIPAVVSGSDSLKKRVMLGAYNAFGAYLGLKPVTLKQ